MPHALPYDYPQPYPRARVSVDGRSWPAVLRRRSWDVEASAWRVDVWIDRRRTAMRVGVDVIELVTHKDADE